MCVLQELSGRKCLIRWNDFTGESFMENVCMYLCVHVCVHQQHRTRQEGVVPSSQETKMEQRSLSRTGSAETSDVGDTDT